MIHYARLENSPRLKRLLATLQEAGLIGLSTREIITKANICAVNTAVDELRENGFQVHCWPDGKSRDGGNVYRYRLVGEGA